ncbi:MAG: hypothetical protein WAL99_04675 [Pseudonocardiaceae bacterium]
MYDAKLPDGYELVDIDGVDLDADEPDRSWEVIDDSLVSVLRQETRFGLAKGSVSPVSTGDPGRAGFDVPLICVLHAHPESDVRWARLVVDFAPTVGATVEDMSPQTITGTTPIEVQTTVGVGLSFSALSSAVDAKLNPEITRKKTVYFPELTSSGPGFHQAYWTFMAGNQPTVHVDRELRLLVSAPAAQPLYAAFTLRAKIAPKGVARLLPFVARVGKAGRTYRLT